MQPILWTLAEATPALVKHARSVRQFDVPIKLPWLMDYQNMQIMFDAFTIKTC